MILLVWHLFHEFASTKLFHLETSKKRKWSILALSVEVYLTLFTCQMVDGDGMGRKSRVMYIEYCENVKAFTF
jgi:hypothetical protein